MSSAFALGQEGPMEAVKPPSVGENIQRLRKQQKLTLEVLSEKSGVSKAMLSQIESAKVNPTVATIWKIARGLGVEIHALLKGSGESMRRFEVNRKESITILDTDEEGVHVKVLSPISMAEDLEMYSLTLKSKGVLRSAPHYPRTEEFLTVLEGKVRVTAGANKADLGEGDFIMYHCDIEHAIENLGGREAKLFLVVRFNKSQWD